MKFSVQIILYGFVVFGFLACGGGGESAENTSTSAIDEQSTLVDAPINTGNIPSVSPSTQSSSEIMSRIQNASLDIPYSEITTGIEQASGTGPFYGADAHGKAVFMVFMAEKYFGMNNWVFCHEASNDCYREIDNSNNQRFINLTEFADGKLFMFNMDKRVDPGAYGHTLAYYNPNTKTLVKNALDIPGLDGGAAMSLGVDGYLYLSGANHRDANHYASYARVNPKDLNDMNYHTAYYKDLYVDRTRSIAADATHVYQAMGDGIWELIAINQASQTSVKLLEAKFFEIQQLKDGVGLKYTDAQDIKHVAWLFNGTLYPTDTLDSRPPWYVEGVTPDNHPRDNPEGYWAYAEYWDIAPGVSKPTITNLNLEAKPTTPGLGEITLGALINDVQYNFSIEVDTYVQPTTGIQVIDENRIMLKGRSYSGYSMLNTNNDTSKYLGRVSASAKVNKPFFDYSSNEKKFMTSGYPSGNTYYYTLDDTNKKFSNENINDSLGYLRDLADRNNPGEGNNIDIHRPTGMVQIEETVYFIGMQYRSGVGGALIAWNTLTDEKYAIKKGIFDNYQPRDMIRIGDKIAIATQAVDNSSYGGLTRPITPKILIFDPKTQGIVKEYTPLEGLPPIDSGRIQSLDERHIIGLTNNGGTPNNVTDSYSSRMYLYIIDTYTDEVVMKKSIETGNYMRVESEGSAFIDGFDFIANGDYIYTWLGARTLSTIDKNGEIEAHGLMPYQSKMAFANGSIYMTGDKKLRKINNPKK